MSSSTSGTSLVPLKKRPAYLLVFEALEDEILSGRLSDGEAIPTEMELCRQFDVQRSTVREGIRLLEQTGLVSRGQGKRLTVIRPRREDAAESTSRGLERHGVRFIDVWEANHAILPEAARLAAQRMVADDIVRLKAITRQLEASEQSSDIVTLSIQYLVDVADATGNKVISVMLHSLQLLLQSSLQQVVDALPDPGNRIVEAQHQINTALESRNSDQAALWMERHVRDLRRGYEVAGVDLTREVGTFGRS